MKYNGILYRQGDKDGKETNLEKAIRRIVLSNSPLIFDFCVEGKGESYLCQLSKKEKRIILAVDRWDEIGGINGHFRIFFDDLGKGGIKASVEWKCDNYYLDILWKEGLIPAIVEAMI